MLSMTSNQLAYWNLQETKRANVTKEVETERSNRARETEDNRHNLATEQHNRNVLVETTRSNKANESLKFQQNREQQRSNFVNEALKREQNAETRRSNMENERQKTLDRGETIRHNKEVEETNRKSNAIKQEEVSVKDDYYTGQNEQAARANDINSWRAITGGFKDIAGTLISGIKKIDVFPGMGTVVESVTPWLR